MSRKEENTGFICENCGEEVLPLTNGSYRNHCPFCLYSLHIDNTPGDRGSECKGKMKPIRVIHNSNKGFQIVHKCLKCGFERNNIVNEDTRQPDNIKVITDIMRRSAG